MATVIEALGQASANYGWVAARPNGVILEVGPNGKIYRLKAAKRYGWTPQLLDLAADDWAAAPLAQALQALRLTDAD